MDSALLNANLTNPTLLFFLLGIIAKLVKSDLEVPPTSAKFISLYLLFAIGFKGGQELTHSTLDGTIVASLVFGMVVAAAYGSVSAVTFVAATGFLETRELTFGGHMVAIMALMESPAIIVGMVLLKRYDREGSDHTSLGQVIKHSLTNGSVLLLIGSLAIGLVADAKQAQGIKPFTTDIFKGFLAIFLLEMGMVTAARFGAFRKYGLPASATAVLIPLINGSLVAWFSGFITPVVGDRFMFAVLAASASYIAVPAAMRLAAPKADPGLYIPMALGITFPFNLMIGMPVYFAIINL